MRYKYKERNMDRRNFIRLATAGAATGIIAPKMVLASSSSMAGGLYYTKDAPGRWSKKVGGHLPTIEVAGKSIKVTTPHSMNDYEHYIIKHVVLDKDFQFVAENMFKPGKDVVAISDFDLGKYSGPVHILSVCNKHDTWMNIAEV
jgi:superoxide reductase